MKSAILASLLLSGMFAMAMAAPARASEIDPQHTRIGFMLKTRWGQSLQGSFPTYEGRVETLGDGHFRVRLRMSARDVEIIGHPNYTGMTRGRGFFEADRFPDVEFVSDPYLPQLIERGGKLGGVLTIRDTGRRETFMIEPSACARAAFDCDVVANGSVRRSDYGVDRWIFAVSDIVRFTLRLRMREAGK